MDSWSLHIEKVSNGYVARYVDQYEDGGKFIQTVVFEAPEDETERLSAMVTEEMEKTLPLDVPVKVGVKTGANWAEC